ncbi:small s protein [Apiospora kogelbergensis]|uniref:Small s protein n=1 Tax=Apiospora kogelbergensis TaxID=1337665 RepID=A0AAW0QN22_9PEZI
MDPGTAIGLAGTVYKLVIAGIEFVGDAKQVYSKGGTDDNRDLDAVAQDIQSASASLEEQLDQAKTHAEGSDGGSELTAEDEELRQLAVRASSIGKELSEALGKAQISEKSKFKAFKAVIRKNWDADDIKKIESRLNGVRSELQLRVLVSIRRNLDRPQNEPYKPMLTTLESLVNHQAQSVDDRRRMMETLSRTEELTMSMKTELLVSKQQILAELRTPQPPPMIPFMASTGEEEARTRVEDAILASLWYSGRDDREESISEAHKKTFEWLFQDAATSNDTFDSLVEFLKSDTRKAYWITGKPGSGKSTAMKFLLDDPRTDELLQHWSGAKRVLKASFYFFYNGGDKQKSELGLLSSLLYTLLQQERKLIQVGFKGRFEAALGGQSTTEMPSIFEARRALREIARCNPDIFFFLAVDGLDEFDPEVSTTDVSSLLDLTRILSGFRNAKMILSSRPLSAFEQGFADCPSLAIHTLTRLDIQSYVFDKLQSHPRMKMLMSRDEGKATALIQSVNDNSSGVFLWVRLVVQSLLEGLESSDGLEELQVRLEELPHDLHALYSVMLSRIPSNYLPQTAKLIQIVETATVDGHHFSLLGLWYADQWTDHDLFDGPVNPISQDQIVARTEDMRGRLRSRCLGLVEIQQSSVTESTICDPDRPPNGDIHDPSNAHLILRVKFIHRTVSEFIAKQDIRNRFVDLPSLSTFNPNWALSRAAIATVKEFIPGKPTDRIVLMKLIWYVQWCLRRNPDNPSYQLKLLNELDTVMSKHLANQLLEEGDSMGSKYGFTESRDAHWSSWFDIAVPKKSSDNTGEEEKEAGKKEKKRWSLAVGLRAVCHVAMDAWPYDGDKRDVVQLLVANGGSPLEEFCGKTVWYWYLRAHQSGCFHWPEYGFFIPFWANWPHSLDIKLTLLGLGADVNGRIPRSSPSRAQSGIDMRGRSCTLLLAARSAHELITESMARPGIDTAKVKELKEKLIHNKGLIERMIEFLEVRDAEEQEWDAEGNLVLPPPAAHDPAENTTDSQQTVPVSVPKPDHGDAQASPELKEENDGPMKEVKTGILESASHRSEADPSDEMTTAHMARSRGSRMRGKISNWVKLFSGKPKTNH